MDEAFLQEDEAEDAAEARERDAAAAERSRQAAAKRPQPLDQGGGEAGRGAVCGRACREMRPFAKQGALVSCAVPLVAAPNCLSAPCCLPLCRHVLLRARHALGQAAGGTGAAASRAAEAAGGASGSSGGGARSSSSRRQGVIVGTVQRQLQAQCSACIWVDTLVKQCRLKSVCAARFCARSKI